MNRKWLRLSAAMLLVMMLLMMSLKITAEPAFVSQASAYALIELESGKLLKGENVGLRLPMASTTKIMTAMIVIENCGTDEEVVIADEAVGTEGSSVYLCKGERMTVKDLLYGLMLASGNDAAVALAIHTAGTVKAFVDLMNEKADSLGLTSTHFITPSGLHDDSHLTTAYELCLITREALKNDLFREIVSTKYYTTESGDKTRTFKNKNSLLWNYDGAFGVKTGYTMAAGRCLVFGAERDGMTLVGALLNCRPMFEKAAELMDGAFENYTKMTVVEANTPVLKTFVENSPGGILEVVTKGSIITVMQNGEEGSFRILPKLFEPLKAPILSGETVGILEVYDDAELIGSTELIAAESVPEKGFRYWWERLIGDFASKNRIGAQ